MNEGHKYISIRNQTCPDERCSFYRRGLAGNVIVHSRKYARFKCKGCNKTWVASRNEFYYGLKKGLEQIEFAQKLLEQNISVRKIAQTVGISPGTVQRWKFRLMPVR